jgi:hypothetical protein
MFCTKCGSPAQPGARYCASCGAPLHTPAAATPTGPAMPAAPQSAVLPASNLVYLFGDRFVERDTAFAPGEKLPCSEIKVKKKDLAEAMLAGAFVWLAQSSRVTLPTGQKGSLVWKRTGAFVAVTRRDPVDPGGLESRLLHSVTGNLQSDSVEDAIFRAIGNTSVDPWGDVIEITKSFLLQMGYFQEGDRAGVVKLFAGRKYVPLCDRIATLQAGIPAVQAMISATQSANPAFYRMLYEDVRKGIDSRYEAPDNDFSSDSDSST